MISLKASMTGRSPSYAGVENKSAGFTKFLPDRVLNVGYKDFFLFYGNEKKPNQRRNFYRLSMPRKRDQEARAEQLSCLSRGCLSVRH
jgi:hypothetical protein